MIKAVIFDLDDTLIDWSERAEVDWEAFHRSRLRSVYDHLADEGHCLPDFDSLVGLYAELTLAAWTEANRTLQAPHLGRVLADIFGRYGVPTAGRDLTPWLRAYGSPVIPGVRVFPEVPAVLEALRRHHLQLGIVTNAYQPMWMRDGELVALGLPPDLFALRTSAADVGVLKPHPAIFEHALGALGVTADEAIFVGDNPAADIAGAQGAGMRAVLRVVPGATPVPHVQPDAAVHSLAELLPLLDEWYPGWRNGATPPAPAGRPASP